MNLLREGEADVNTFLALKIERDSTRIEVSNYLKDGGDGGAEWPFRCMEDSRSPGDKWVCPSSRGWIVYHFDKPISIRGYGLVTGNDAPGRDPKDWTFNIMDAIKVHIEGVTEYGWEPVDIRKDIKFKDRHELQKFAINGGKRIVNSIKLDI